MNMGKNDAEYYFLQPINDTCSTTIYVPTQNEALISKMRRLLSVEEIHALIRTMPDGNTIWIDDDKIRREQYKNILAVGNRVELVRLIKTLHSHQETLAATGKKLHLDDAKIMKAAEKTLHEEFAHVLNITLEQVVPFIFEQLDVKGKY
jgi:CarD family transcriptional regulator